LLDGLEQGLEVSSTESIVITSLNNFNEKCWAVLEWFSEYLEEITLLVEVYQKIQFTNDLEILRYLGAAVTETLGDVVVV